VRSLSSEILKSGAEFDLRLNVMMFAVRKYFTNA
jgi:hypothetical protein